MTKAFLIVISSLMIISCNNENQITQFHDLRQITWLIGRWKMDGKAIIETWERTNDTQISGLAISQENGESKVLEVLKLIEQEGEFYYSATVANQNNGSAVLFKLVFVNDNKLIFENPRHDYPQRIEYTKNDIGQSILVKLSGGGKTQKYKFNKFE